MQHVIELPPKLVPVFSGDADVRGAYGGRGSAKTRSFATMFAFDGVRLALAGQHGQILGAREYQNSLDDSSFAEVKAAIAESWLHEYYDCGENYIRTKPGLPGRIDCTFAGFQKVNSLKSRSRIWRAWVDEAEDVKEAAWEKFIPTLREEDGKFQAELWPTWNPERKGSATDRRFRQNPPPGAKIVALNWRDNPWFPRKLNRTRLDDFEQRPDRYDWVWEGEYKTAETGAYFAKLLAAAKASGRIRPLAYDPMFPLKSFHDIGGAGRNADTYVIWVVQFAGQEIRLLDCYQAQGQELGYHAEWLRRNGYTSAEVVLPHDGANSSVQSRKRVEDHWRDAGFKARTIPNQGAGAANMRIEAVRRLGPRMVFDEDKTKDARVELGLYAPKINTQTGADMGPNHDFSHVPDALGLMAIDHREPKKPFGTDTMKVPNVGAV
ncbi:MAG: phage terminase large subunit [Pseudomonadota bacterium]